MVAKAPDVFIEASSTPKVAALTSNNIHLIGFACGIGAPDQGCADGPNALKQMGLSRVLQERGINAKWKCFIKPSTQELDSKLNIDYLSLQYRLLAQEVANSVHQQEMFTVIGGDHSCAIGTWSGAAYQIRNLGPLGLIWLDAHMDSHTFTTSHSGALNGMPVACLLGYGDHRLTSILTAIPKVSPKHACLIGIRSFETEEAQLLKRLGVKVFFMQEIKERGLHNVLGEAITIVNQDTAGFGLSIDLDAIDPLNAPGVGTPELDGLSKEELLDALKIFPQQRKLLGIEIAELNPMLDQNQMTAKLAIEALVTCLVKD